MAIKFLNSVNADSGVLYVDAANDRVGIGTTSPSNKLHIADSGEIIRIESTSTSGYIVFRESTTARGYIGLGDNGTIFTGATTDSISLRSNSDLHLGGGGNNLQMTLDGTNVGIGTTSPARKLQVGDGTADDRIRVYFSDNTYTEQTGYGMEFSRPASYIRPLTDNINNLYIGQSTKTWATLQTDATSHSFNNNGSTLMYIASDGDVGIGTTSPAQKLHVSGGHILLDNNTEIRQKDSGGSERTIIELDSSNDLNIGGSYAGALKFIGGGSYAEVMRIHDDGNVGIGTTSPAQKLDVDGNIQILDTDTVDGNVFGYLNFHSTSGGSTGNHARIASIRDSNGAGQMLLYTKTGGAITEKVRITSAGNVGIGTTSPNAMLHVTNSIQVDGGDTFGVDNAGHQIYMSSGGSGLGGEFGSGYARNLIKSDGSATIQIGDNTSLISRILLDAGSSGTNGYISLQTKQVERVRINQDGNVGIGTTSPGANLHIAGGVTILGQNKIDGGSDNLKIMSDYANVSGSSTIEFSVDGSEKMRIDNNGNVGIGTTSPSNELEVNEAGSLKAGGKIHFTSIESVSGAGIVNGTVIKLNDEHDTDLNTSYHYVIQTTTDGTGTNSGAKYIVWYDNDNTQWVSRFVSRSGSDSNHPQVGVDGSNVKLFDTHSGTYNHRYIVTAYLKSDPDGTPHFLGADYHFQRDANNLFYDEGNVGIGTTSPNALLHVYSTGNGEIEVERASGALFNIQSQSAAAAIGTDSNHPLYFKTNAGTRLTIKTDGNVGIGITSPSAPLTFGKSVYGAESSENYFRIKFQDQGGTHNDVGIGQPASGALGFNITAGNYFSFNNGTSGEIARLNGTGLGIGTTNPSYKLEVNADSTSGVMSVKNAANSRDTFRSENAAGTRTFNIGNDASGHGIVLVRNSSGTTTSYLAGSGNSYLNAGNVGIGTTSPAQKLEVSFAGSVYGARFTRNDAAGSSLIEFANNAGVKSIVGYDAGTDAYRIGTPSSNYNLIVKQSGNVGIGTTSPSEKLHVSGNAWLGTIKQNTSTILQRVNTSWTNNPTTDVLYNAWTSSTGDYIVLRPPGNQASEGAFVAAKNGAFFGQHASTGAITDSSTAPLSTTWARIAATSFFNGNVGIGETSIDAKLHITTSGSGLVNQKFESQGSAAWRLGIPDSSTSFVFDNANDDLSSSKFSIDASGNVTAAGDVTAYSDLRVKENVKELTGSLDKVSKMRGVSYNKIGSNEASVGVIAQEVREVIPELVKEDEDGMLSVAYGNITAVLIEAIKEQQAQIDELKEIIDGLTK